MFKAFSIGLFWKFFSFPFYSEVIQRIWFLILTQVKFYGWGWIQWHAQHFLRENRDADCAGYVSVLYNLNREIYQYDDGNAATQKILYFVVKETTFSMDECWGNKGNMGKFSPSHIGWIVFLLAWIAWHIPKKTCSSIWCVLRRAFPPKIHFSSPSHWIIRNNFQRDGCFIHGPEFQSVCREPVNWKGKHCFYYKIRWSHLTRKKYVKKILIKKT